MSSRLLKLTFLTMALASLSLLARPVAADTIRGKIDSAGAGKISVIDSESMRHTFQVADSAKITLDGKKVKLEDLTKGASAEIVTKTKTDNAVAVMIAAESVEQPALPRTVGSAAAQGIFVGRINEAGGGVVSLRDGQGVVRTFEVIRDADITMNGVPVVLERLKPGSSATVTTDSLFNQEVAVRIAATAQFP